MAEQGIDAGKYISYHSWKRQTDISIFIIEDHGSKAPVINIRDDDTMRPLAKNPAGRRCNRNRARRGDNLIGLDIGDPISGAADSALNIFNPG